MPFMRASIFLLLVFASAACGGNVVVDPTPSTGTGGATLTGSTSSASTSGGACTKGVCPMFPPSAGAPCPCDGQECPYDQCPEDGPLTTATCAAGVWSLQSASCLGACGSTQCTPGFVCLHHVGGPIGTMPEECVPDPCGSSPLSCSCATSLCPTGEGFTCAVMGGDLVCGCPLCK
jgi:hypothetical protein